MDGLKLTDHYEDDGNNDGNDDDGDDDQGCGWSSKTYGEPRSRTQVQLWQRSQLQTSPEGSS